MLTLTLHFAPDTCARVPLIALEEIGCPYKIEIVAFARDSIAHQSIWR